MRIALVSEGTYPYAMGGVSIWCEQLIRGMPDYRWEVVALTVDGTEEPVFERPANLDQVHSIPLWGGRPAGRRPTRGALVPSGRPGAEFIESYEVFLRALVTPLESTRSQAGAVNRSTFLLALRGMFEYARGGGDLGAALLSNEALRMMLEAWHTLRVEETGPAPTVADALEAAWLISHMLRPLSAPPVRADIVHSSMNGLSTLVGMAATWTYGTPLVLSEHGIYLRERYISYLHDDAPHPVRVLVLSFFRSLAGAAYLITGALAPHSQYNRRWQLHNGADPERMWTMYNGVDPDEFPPAAGEPDVPTISFMGRIDPLKDLHTLIRAFALVREEIPNARLRIFGGTPAANKVYHESCAALIDELGLTGHAVLEGRVGSAVEAYHAGSLVALTSISEGFPYTVVEAMACGRPTVCTNVGGVAEAVGDTGFVVAPRDVPAIAAACVRMLNDRELRLRLGAAARDRVLERFTLQRSLQAYRDIYEGLATPRTSPAPKRLRGQAQGWVRVPNRTTRPGVASVAARPEPTPVAARPEPTPVTTRPEVMPVAAPPEPTPVTVRPEAVPVAARVPRQRGPEQYSSAAYRTHHDPNSSGSELPQPAVTPPAGAPDDEPTVGILRAAGGR
ncbi:Glycosyltransferase involved in cell wall bisynthesis [Micromonospora matsumotoense]|uniref:Glycosyltransferase involved in cell wall bisynthesis n=1 Tax=Micromonospora matsumotoense TaxID=121616 RepID=A0A1C4YF17_9ACTN|nr:GT4 family glycosyltransferase PelF [Micromonospora matsumotoense]SCF19319.1 Glycosyltransferase involved in cell wall bisynthesis [Micromonospora matsumotoense]